MTLEIALMIVGFLIVIVGIVSGITSIYIQTYTILYNNYQKFT